MKISGILIGILLLGGSVVAQSIPPPTPVRPSNTVSVNLMEGGSLVSLNYERFVLNKPNHMLALMVGMGVGVLGKPDFGDNFDLQTLCFNLPHHLTTNIGGGHHFFEAGIGGMAINADFLNHYLVYPLIGYRFQNSGKYPTSFRFFVQYPLVQTSDPVYFIPVGISLGQSF